MVKLGDLMKVTRDDIQDFPGDTIDLIMELQKDGWRAQRSNRNHVMLLAPDGVTRYSASRNASSAKYLSEDIARYKRGDKLDGVQEPSASEVKAVLKMTAKEKVPCPQVDCNRFFNSQEKVNVHIAVDHEGYVKCPDCNETRENVRKLSIHRTHAHGYESPRKAQRKRQEAARAAKKAETSTISEKDIQELRGGPIDLEELLDFDGPLPNWVVDANGAVHDVAQVNGYVAGTSPLIDDHIRRHADETTKIIHEASESTGRMPGIVETYLEGASEELTSSTLQTRGEAGESTGRTQLDFSQTNVTPTKLSPEDIYRKTVNQLNHNVSEPEPLEFIDERDSWTLDLEPILDMDIRTVARVLNAAGLKLEMRSWFGDKGD